ncbi:MAG: hypothetical protein OXF08_04420 [Bacteroidetes bacterium]|nr:hypothetical protein [Bacteroidota bacterium]
MSLRNTSWKCRLGILSFLNIRQKELTYPSFSIELLRSLPVPHPDHCDIRKLADVFDQYSEMPLRPLPEICTDEIRHDIDRAVIQHIPGIPWNYVEHIREKIAYEPSVHNKKEPVEF